MGLRPLPGNQHFVASFGRPNTGISHDQNGLGENEDKQNETDSDHIPAWIDFNDSVVYIVKRIH